MNRQSFICVLWGLSGLLLMSCAAAADPAKPADLTAGWYRQPLKFEVQHPYDLKLDQRYHFDPATGIYDLWVLFTDKPHAPPPNKTDARTEIRFVDVYHHGQHMFDADMYIVPGTYSGVMQVLADNRGPVLLLVVFPDGSLGPEKAPERMARNMFGRWFNLKVIHDPLKQFDVYIDNVHVGTVLDDSQRSKTTKTGWYFKCGVYSRIDSNRSEVMVRNLNYWTRTPATQPVTNTLAPTRSPSTEP